MTALQDIENVFNMLHDGSITGWSGDRHCLTLRVDCEYLAERIDPSFESFFVELTEIEMLRFEAWTTPVWILTNLAGISQNDLEILSAASKENRVEITCNCWNGPDFRGGTLLLSARSIKIFDQGRREITIEFLAGVAKKYWDKFSA